MKWKYYYITWDSDLRVVVSRLQPEKVTFRGSEVMINIMSSFIKISFKKCQNVQPFMFSKKSASKRIFFPSEFRIMHLGALWPITLEDCQELTMTGLFPRFALAPVPQIPPLPNSSRNLFPHVLPSSLGYSVFFFIPLLLFSDFKLHPTKSLICFAVPSGCHILSLLFICQLLKQMVSICHCHLWFRQPPLSL